MNLYTKTYHFEFDKVKKDRVIALLSDLHDSSKVSYETITLLTKDIATSEPDIICFAGDLINDAKKTIETEKYQHLIVWFETLAKIAPVCIIRGNHDLLTRDEKNKNWHYYDSSVLFDTLASLDNVYLLENGSAPFIDDELTISGFDLGKFTEKYYEEHRESYAAFKLYANKPLTQMEESLDPEKFNILMYHSPENIVGKNRNKYNLSLFGHMHNGALPNFLDKKITGTKGFIAPISGFFPEYSRNSITESPDNVSVIASPITTIASQNDSPLVRALYKPGIQYITLSGKK